MTPTPMSFETWWAYYTAVLTREPYPDERLTARQAWDAATERAAGVVEDFPARPVDPHDRAGLAAAIRAGAPPAAGGEAGDA